MHVGLGVLRGHGGEKGEEILRGDAVVGRRGTLFAAMEDWVDENVGVVGHLVACSVDERFVEFDLTSETYLELQPATNSYVLVYLDELKSFGLSLSDLLELRLQTG